jgi:serine/threonine protein kinase
MQTMTCPTSEQLKAYLSGKVDDDSAVTLAQHLLDCPACESTAVELEKEPDTLVELLQTEKPLTGQPDDKPIAAFENQSAGSFNTLQMPQVLGQYRLLSRLGTGGMGAVYLAHHKSLDKQVAIKLLPTLPAQNSDFLARFQREMRAAGKLDHPAIVRTTDAGEQQGIHFLVMDAIDGMDLGRLLRIEDKLSIADACEIVRQAAIGLAHAHEKGIVHRDVKPSNLMLDANGQVRILDFGLAQIGFWESGSAEITTVGQLMGTLDYMAPEQAERGGAVDYRADLYSLGATLFRLLTGRAPLAAAPNLTPLEKLRLLATHRPPKLLSLRPDAPEPLSQIVDAMLAREPSGRPASAIHAAELLEPFGAKSDLVQLLQRVRSKPVSEESSFILNPLLQRDLAEPRVPAVAPEVAAAPDAAPKTSESRSRWIPRWPTWISLAGCSALCFAGILFVLETSKGQLVINSEADVSVKIVGVDDSGKRSEVEQLKIVPGTKTTRLRSGKYEITMDAASDSFGLTNGNFTIQNGQTIVATIKRTPSTIDVPTVANPAVAAPEDARLTEVVYDNEKLDTWLRRLKFERNPQEITRTLNAISRLASLELRDLIHDPLVEFACREGTSEEHHFLTVWALKKCCGKTLPESLAKILQGLRDDKHRTRFLLLAMNPVATDSYPISHDSSFLIESVNLLDGKSQEDVIQAALTLRTLVSELPNNRIEADVQQKILQKFGNTAVLTNGRFWLAQGIQDWGPAMRAAVLQRAFSIIAAESEVDDPLLCQALAIARQGLDRWDSVPEEIRQKAIEQMIKRLDAAAREPSKHVHLQKVPDLFKQLAIPIVDGVQPFDNRNYETSSANTIVQILNIVVDMKVNSNAILQKMTPAVQALHESIDNLKLMDSKISRLGNEDWHLQMMDSRSGKDQWVLHIWYIQSGSLLGKDLETLRLRPERLYLEDRERKNRFVQPGDTLAIYIPNFLPERGDPPVIQAGTSTVVVGFPVPVSKDGTIQLRGFEPIKVQDLELSQVQEEILRQFGKFTTKPNTWQVTVQFLLRANRPQELRNLTGTGLAPPTK